MRRIAPGGSIVNLMTLRDKYILPYLHKYGSYLRFVNMFELIISRENQ